MTQPALSIGPTSTVAEAMDLMARRHVRHLPVVTGDGTLIGLLSDRDARRAAPSPLQAAQADAEAELEALTVERVMVRAPWTVSPKATAHDAVQTFVAKKFGALPVVEDGKLVGIVTPIDVMRAWLKP